MPKKLSIAGAIEANRLSSDVPLLCLLDLQLLNPITGEWSPPRHIARNPEPVVFQERVYEAGVFDIQISQEAGTQTDVTLSVNDYTQELQALMEQFQGGIGSAVTFYIVNGAALDQPADATEFYSVVASSSADYTQSFTLGAENTLAMTFPRRRQTRDFCQWGYKSPECGYTGGLPSCSLTLKGSNGCEAHNNVINFGGYPGINSNGLRYV